MNELTLQIPHFNQAATSSESRTALQLPVPRIPAIEILIDDDGGDAQRHVRLPGNGGGQLKPKGGIWL
jgi:hypothetical protein